MWNYQSRTNPYHLYKVHYSDKFNTRIICDDMREDTIPNIIFKQDYFLCDYTIKEWECILSELLKKYIINNNSKYLILCEHACVKIGRSQRRLLEYIRRNEYWMLKQSRMLNQHFPISEKVKDLLNRI